ncbi:MAG: dienelactone hydrolase family protein [Gemmatimonadales bacterium]|nr:dienelactone hydrolase family protein [Gemmatimonadales bacterium]
MGSMVTYPANGHTTSGYLALPPSGTGPGVLVIQEWWGLVDHIKAVADRFAAAGFVALAPDFYNGQSTKSPDAAAKLFMAVNIDRAGADLRGSAQYLLGRPEVVSRRVGALGFCMGGQLALYGGMIDPDRIGAVVDFYGIHPNVPIDPARLTVPVLGHFGTRDASVPRATIDALAAAVRAAGGSFEAHFYEADHAFFNDTRPQVFHEPSARLAWDRSLAFLKGHLR